MKHPGGNPNLKKGVVLNPNGRPKGSKNKFTTLKDAFIDAFKELGGKEALLEWINENRKYDGPRKLEFFKMITKMLPADVNVSGTLNSNISLTTVKGLIENANTDDDSSRGSQSS